MDAKGLEATAGFGFNTSVLLMFTTLGLIVYFIINRRQRQERWEKYGVKHVDIPMQQLPTILNQNMMRDHGPTVGIKKDVLILITRDLDILKQVLVKDFNNFVNRNDILATKCPVGKGVFFLLDHDWKRIRQLMSPSFSTGKLKRIGTHVQEAAVKFSKVFEDCARNVSLLKLFHTTGQYSSSIIAKTAFGIQADSIGEEEDDQFTNAIKRLFKTRTKIGLFFVLFLLRFRALRNILVYTVGLYFPDPVTKMSNDYFNAVLKESIAEREKAVRQGYQSVNSDFLQSLVSTKIAAEEAAAGRSQQGEKAATETQKVPAVRKTITTDEVIAQSIFTILAAYETTASTLQFCLFKLAQNPDIQEKVYQEILEVVEHENPSHEELGKLRYMEQVLNETLRMFPPVTIITRMAHESRTYGGVTIPAGAGVSVPIREIHRDPTHYPDPELFDPERFNEENKAKRHPLAFMPFGWGPRLCIGMRLAYLELKTALVQVLRKVEVELNSTTVPRKGEDITLNFVLFPRPNDPIKLAVKLRGDNF